MSPSRNPRTVGREAVEARADEDAVDDQVGFLAVARSARLRRRPESFVPPAPAAEVIVIRRTTPKSGRVGHQVRRAAEAVPFDVQRVESPGEAGAQVRR